MALRLPEFFSRTDTKSRLMLITVVLSTVAAVIFFGNRFLGDKKTAGSAKVASAPTNLQSVPGSKVSQEYYKALMQSNEQAAKKAQMTGGSAVPTLVNIPTQQQSGFTSASSNCGTVCPGDDSDNVVEDVNNLVKGNHLSQERANQLLDMIKNNVTPAEFSATLDQLVREGKLTPEEARRLLEEDKRHYANSLVADSAKTIDAVIKAGQLPIDAGSSLLAMQKRGASATEYGAALDQLVRENKITPQMATQLLAQYTQQHSQEAAKRSAYELQKMAKEGQITSDVANNLTALQEKNIPVSKYASELSSLVNEGKITPAAAKKLLEAYQKQRMALGPSSQQLSESIANAENDAAAGVDDLVRQGKISPAAAETLLALQRQNVSGEEYQKAVDDLVRQGKISPDEAKKLMSQYQALHNARGDDIVASAEAKAAADVYDLIKQGKISQATADTLLALQKQNVPAGDYQKKLDDLVREGKLSPEEAKKLMAQYNALHGVREEVKTLAALQANNASASQYATELKKAVIAGVLSPEEAAKLVKNYQAATMAVVPEGGLTKGVEANLPGAEDFARLQQRLQQQQKPAAPTATSEQFSAAQAQAAAEAAQAKQQRIQDLMSGMKAQADKLVVSWQPPVMQFKAGAAPTTAKSTATPGGVAAAASGGSSSGLGSILGGGSNSAAAPLIKAGTIYFAVLDTAVNSDYPDTPVMATIVDGPFKGAKLLGKVSINQGQSQDRVALNFTLIDMQDWPKTKSVSAFAIDPDTARTVMASNVDYHYLKRYGSIMASAFMTGYANAITQEGTSTTGIFGTSSTHAALSPANKFAVGLGQVGTALGTAVSGYVNTPPTVTVKAGVGLGILFMSDVS